jgi:predicted TIM-barrel fold metal-dependent hydrolase
MLIVDAQVHIWGSGTPIGAHRQTSAFSADELLEEMDAAGVDAAVIHPPGWDPGSNDLALDAARRHPDRLSILGKVPLDRPESRALLDGWKRQPGMLGLRFVFLQPHQRTWPTDGTMDWLWPAAERAGIPVALLAGNFLGVVGRVAERHPALKLIIDHLGRPPGASPEGAWANLPEMLALAKHPNVAIKATGAPSYSTEAYPYRDIHDHLRRIHDAFGPARMFWGTDITRMPCSWRQCVTMFTEELPWLSARDRELVMGRALCTWLDWKIPGTAGQGVRR